MVTELKPMMVGLVFLAAFFPPGWWSLAQAQSQRSQQEEIEKLKHVRVGDLVEVTYTEALAISMEEADQ